MLMPTWGMAVPAGALAAWFTAFAVKHVIADFTFQTPWMAFGKEREKGWLTPLFVHCAIHGTMTLCIVLVSMPRLWTLAFLDFGIHFVIDRTKALIGNRYNLTPDDRPFWALLGTDQTLHHATGFVFALLLAANAE